MSDLLFIFQLVLQLARNPWRSSGNFFSSSSMSVLAVSTRHLRSILLELPHLFDRFYRSDRSRNSATGGYGIGLAIAKAIVNTHRGKIQASTEDGKSLTIEAVFPG